MVNLQYVIRQAMVVEPVSSERYQLARAHIKDSDQPCASAQADLSL